jgi:3-oxoacyl-[acyl-carrier-protein] synthase II
VREQAVVTGLGLAAGGIDRAADLLDALEDGHEPGAFDPRSRLGERRSRYHDAATLMALCAATEALDRMPRTGDDHGETAGVVVSSNLGNLDTVCRVVEVLRRRGSAEALSPMDLPKASSNVIASTLAIQFDCRGVNLTVCNGASSGTDALYLAAVAIGAGRARRVLVVGVEAAHPPARRLLEPADGGRGKGKARLVGGAAAVVIEAASSASSRGARTYAQIDAYAHHMGKSPVVGSIDAALSRAGERRPGLWIVPEEDGSPADVEGSGLPFDGGLPPRVLDLSVRFGLLYGALGVFQCVAASLWLESAATNDGHRRTAVLTSGNRREGASSLLMRVGRDGRSQCQSE